MSWDWIELSYTVYTQGQKHDSAIATCMNCNHGCIYIYIYIFFWIPYWPRTLINILWPPLDANQYGGPSWRNGSIFSCCKGLWDCLATEPIATKHQSVFWLVSQSRVCRPYALAAVSRYHLQWPVLTLWLQWLTIDCDETILNYEKNNNSNNPMW